MRVLIQILKKIFLIHIYRHTHSGQTVWYIIFRIRSRILIPAVRPGTIYGMSLPVPTFRPPPPEAGSAVPRGCLATDP